MAFRKDSFPQESFTSLARQWGMVAAQIFVLTLLSGLPLPFSHFAAVRPAFLLMAVYHWAIFRPQMMPPWGAFLGGLLLDLVGAGPLGLNALTLVGAQAVTRSQRRFLIGQSFPVLWMCFFLVSAGAFACQWTVFSAFSAAFSPPRPMLVGALLTGLFYPLVAAALNTLVKKL
jgi:rod shape-determining protein MreD